MRFKVGDIVKFNNLVAGSYYNLTNEHMTAGKVVKTYPFDDVMFIEILGHETKKQYIGHAFKVECQHFKLHPNYHIIQKENYEF